MKVLIVGSGGREHALAWACSRSGLSPQIYCAPGNGGTTRIAENVDIKADDLGDIVDFVRKETVDLTIVGPEAPLVNGLVDKLTARGYRVFGPSKSAAGIEGSKSFSKSLMQETGVPTAEYRTFTEFDEARRYILESGGNVVVKASGLAAGKGATVCINKEEAVLVAEAMLLKCKFGDASREIVIEKCLKGSEMSLMAFSDGEDYLLLPPSRDHKRAYDNDEGPNTGGMGAYSPLDEFKPDEIAHTAESVFPPVLKRLAELGAPYHGLLYAGLMLTPDGPRVLEFNCRFGDPETQAQLPIMIEDPLEIMLAVSENRLGAWMAEHNCASNDWMKLGGDRHAVTVVAAASGYPAGYVKGMKIENLPEDTDGVIIFHAGTS
ncbi:MAG TPA: phosphoribosylamine--glycine ligase, partial [Bacteroidetes bacterium]|nr:phosphoribosylamine--glycine ligase [Bacteroidota bacterium]